MLNIETMNVPAEVMSNLVMVIQGRFIQTDGSWFEKAGENSFTKHKWCQYCGEELTLIRGYYPRHYCEEF